jgi:hypothetical protein
MAASQLVLYVCGHCHKMMIRTEKLCSEMSALPRGRKVGMLPLTLILCQWRTCNKILTITAEKERLALELQLQNAQLANTKLKMGAPSAAPSSSVKSNGPPTLDELRQSPLVVSKAKASRRSLKVPPTSSSDISDTDGTHSSSEAPHGKKDGYLQFASRSHKHKPKSGAARQARDRVKYDVPWPHEYGQLSSLDYFSDDFGST